MRERLKEQICRQQVMLFPVDVRGDAVPAGTKEELVQALANSACPKSGRRSALFKMTSTPTEPPSKDTRGMASTPVKRICFAPT